MKYITFMNKRGSSLLQDSLPELILAAVGILIISFLLIALIGNWNKKDLNEKEIFNSLKKSLDSAQKEGSSNNFLIYLPFAPVRYFLVYFDDVGYPQVDSFDSYKFFYKGGIPKHTLCICSADVSDENPILCQKKYCTNLPNSISSLTIQNEDVRTKDFFAIPLDLGMNMNVNYNKNTKKYSLNIVSQGHSKPEDYNKTKIRENACREIEIYAEENNYINLPSGSRSVNGLKYEIDNCNEKGSIQLLKRSKVSINEDGISVIELSDETKAIIPSDIRTIVENMKKIIKAEVEYEEEKCNLMISHEMRICLENEAMGPFIDTCRAQISFDKKVDLNFFKKMSIYCTNEKNILEAIQLLKNE